MVKIAIAGGSGGVGQEVIDVLVATQKHEIILLSRKDAPAESNSLAITWVKTNYQNVDELAQILQGVHTVLSFVTEQEDPTSPVQKNLIDASIKARVKRFAPSEWVSSGTKHMGWYAFKETTRKYLKELNKDKKVLEYTLFQPGYFVNYLTRPYPSTKHLPLMDLPWDINNRRWIEVEGGKNARMSLITVEDLCNFVARAIEFEGEWPVDGGIRGDDLSMGELLKLAEKVRGGKPFSVDYPKVQELESGTWKPLRLPIIEHASVPVEQREALALFFISGIMLGVNNNNLHVSDSWNQVFPDFKFTGVEEFLTKAWHGKP